MSDWRGTTSAGREWLTAYGPQLAANSSRLTAEG